MAIESLVAKEAKDRPLYLRMTPEILAEIAFQNANLLASRLSSSYRRDFWSQLALYATRMNESNETYLENSPA